MLRLEEIKRDDWLLGLVPNEAAKVVSVDLSGDALLIVYRPESGGIREETIFRDKEAELSRRDQEPGWRRVTRSRMSISVTKSQPILGLPPVASFAWVSRPSE